MPNKFLQFRRRFTDYLATFVAAGLSTLVVGVLVAIFAYLVIKGAGSVNWAFLTHTPKPVGEVGG
jgi:phosphate transport system permease protein